MAAAEDGRDGRLPSLQRCSGARRFSEARPLHRLAAVPLPYDRSAVIGEVFALRKRGANRKHHPSTALRRSPSPIGPDGPTGEVFAGRRGKRVQRRQAGGLPRNVPESCARRHKPCLWAASAPTGGERADVGIGPYDSPIP